MAIGNTRFLRANIDTQMMLLNRLDEVREIATLKHRMDAAASDIKQIKGGMNYLVKQLSAQPDSPRRRIGFCGDDDTSTKPYGKK